MTEPTSGVPEAPVGVATADEPAPTVAAMPWGGEGEWAVVVQAGSGPSDLHRAAARVPAGLEFEGAYGDVDVILVYRQRTAATPTNDDPTRRNYAYAALRAAFAADDDSAR